MELCGTLQPSLQLYCGPGGNNLLGLKLTLQKWLLLIHLWARDCPVTDAMEEAEVDCLGLSSIGIVYLK